MFFRQGSGSEKRASPRPGGPTQAQLKELRIRARRRLIGALALVLAAVIVVPWLFQEPITGDARAPLVIPAVSSGLPPASDPAATLATTASGEIQLDDTAPTGDLPQTSVQEVVPEPAKQSTPDTNQLASATAAVGSQEPTAPQDPKPAPPKPANNVTKERTDDGSVALALLAGKSPDKLTATPDTGRYVLQAAAYTTESDAMSRRDSLRQAGISDAYVEPGQSGGRTVYRLRVGPFGSQQAAQAAQTRLRALGYQNSLISSQ